MENKKKNKSDQKSSNIQEVIDSRGNDILNLLKNKQSIILRNKNPHSQFSDCKVFVRVRNSKSSDRISCSIGIFTASPSSRRISICAALPIMVLKRISILWCRSIKRHIKGKYLRNKWEPGHDLYFTSLN